MQRIPAFAGMLYSLPWLKVRALLSSAFLEYCQCSRLYARVSLCEAWEMLGEMKEAFSTLSPF